MLGRWARSGRERCPRVGINSIQASALSSLLVPLAGLQVLVDRRGGLSAGTHRKNHGGAAGDDVAASEDAAL